MNNKIDYPQFIYLDSLIKSKYLEPLIADPLSYLYKRQQGEAYAIAAVLGCIEGKRVKSTSRTEIRVFVSWTDDYKVLFRAIAAYDASYDFDTLLDGSLTLKIVEEYANFGFKLLFEKSINIKDIDEMKNLISGYLQKTTDK